MKKIINKAFSEGGRIILGVLFFIPALILEHLEFEYFSLVLYIVALIISGGPVFLSAVRGILRRDFLDEKFLMSLASIGAIILGEERGEGVAVMLFFLVGEFFEHKAVAKSRKSIKALMDICPDMARVVSDDGEELVYAEDVEVGSIISLRSGERVPIDSVVVSGSADVDLSALTGESLPVSVGPDDNIKSGAVVLSGVLRAKTIMLAEQSSAQRVLSLVESANERKSKTENFITAFSRVYTPIVVLLAVLLAIIPPIFEIFSWQDSVYRALTFLVISCPCALVISVPMAFFGGIGCAAASGILYKGGNTFSALAKSKCFVFDKTGTLTTGEFNVSEVYTYGVSKEYLLSVAAGVESESNHPIAECIKRASAAPMAAESVKEHSGKGISAVVSGSLALVGNAKILLDNGVIIPDEFIGKGTVFVSLGGKFIGSIAIFDRIRNEANSALEELRSLGMKRSIMLSGDKRESVERVAEKLLINEAHYELLPEKKFEKLENIIKSEENVVYVGDGINDAPALALASVGVAMGGIGQDSAIESCDVVITSDNLDRLPLAVRIARRTVRFSKENIIFALGVKGVVLILGAIGIANMWLAVFADVGVAFLAILNSMRTLTVKGRRRG